MKPKNIQNFCENEFISFAGYDVYRKIANIMDGLKISSRKILYTCIENNKKNELKKVETLANKVAEYTDYKHGATSLIGVTVGLAQRFTGSNNIPLLKVDGNFGTRIIPEASAGRYISTCCENYVNILFNSKDKEILNKQYNEGKLIEPKFYVPILPMILINGAVGLSIGYAQNILPRNKKEIIEYIKCKISGKKYKNKILPYYNGFKGDIEEISPNTFLIKGKIELNKGIGIITEIPINISYKKYIQILDNLINENIITNYKDKCDISTDNILFEVKFNPTVYQEILNNNFDVYEKLKLKTIEIENYTCLDIDNKIHTYNTIYELLDDYINIRLKYYDLRKNYWLQKYNEKLKFLCSKILFIENIIDNKIIINKQTNDKIIEQLEKNQYIIKYENSYDYLINMPISSLTIEKINEFKNEIIKINKMYKELQNSDLETLWKNDINNFLKECDDH